MNKDLKKILAALEEAGYEVTRTKKGHYAVHLNGEWVTTFAGTASDWRSFKNALAPARRLGFRWPP